MPRLIKVPRRAFMRRYYTIQDEYPGVPTHEVVARTKHEFAVAGVPMPPDLDLTNWREPEDLKT